VAANASALRPAPLLSVRMVEWLLVAALILTLVVVFVHQVRVVQRQAELAAVRSTLGALRTALVFQHLQQQTQASGQTVAVEQRNPFELLQRRPANYAGEFAQDRAAEVPPGSWVFDAQCVCIGYLPQDATDFDNPRGEAMAWYLVEGAPASPLQITPRAAYLWQGERLN